MAHRTLNPRTERTERNVWALHLYSQQVSHQRWISGIHCTQATKHASKGSTLALKPRENITRSPKQGYQRPHEKDSCPPKFKKNKLSRIYTNHYVGVTGTTILTRCQFSDKQIMSVTGHKSIESLKIYKPVSSDEKLMMGNTLGYAL